MNDEVQAFEDPVGPFRGLTIHMVRRGAHHSDGEGFLALFSQNRGTIVR